MRPRNQQLKREVKMEFDLLLFIICILGGAGLVGLATACYLALGDIYDRFFGATETFPP